MVPRSRREARLQEASLPTCSEQVTRRPAGAEGQLHSLPTHGMKGLPLFV